MLERVEASLETARHRLPEQWSEAPTVEGIETVIEEMSELIRRAAAEPA